MRKTHLCPRKLWYRFPCFEYRTSHQENTSGKRFFCTTRQYREQEYRQCGFQAGKTRKIPDRIQSHRSPYHCEERAP